jgi:hypothetical protein
MSAIPSNTDQFLGGLAAGTQALGLASQNQRAKMDFALAQQQMGLERQKMAQQGQQFERGLQAEAENYEKLNASRERMAQAEMGQQQGQFEATMGFNREQAQLERLISMKMKQLDLDLARNEQEIAAMKSDDPRLKALRAKRRQNQLDNARLEEMIGASQIAMNLASGVRGDRINEVTARMDAYQQALSQRRSIAEQAVQAGYQYAVTKDQLEGGFLNEANRLLQSYEMDQARTGEVPVATTPIGAALRLGYDEVQKFFGSTGDADLARRRATEFMRNGGAMATSIVHNAIDLNGTAFGLEGAEKAGAAAAAAEAVTYAGILAGLDPRARGVDQVQTRERIASNIAKMRQFGMGDEQIMAIFDGLDTISMNRAEALASYQASGGDAPEIQLLDESLKGLDTVQDMIQGVLNDKEMMTRVAGRPISDMSKRDMSGVVRKAQVAYGMGQSTELQNLVQELETMGMSQEEINALSARLIEADPRLQFLRPEQYGEMLQGLGRQRVQSVFDALGIEEDLGQLEPQIEAEGRLRGLDEAERRLAEIAGYIGG